MSDTVSFAELDGQHVELLPARTVLSLFSAQNGGGLIPEGGIGKFVPDFVTKLWFGEQPNTNSGASTDGAKSTGGES